VEADARAGEGDDVSPGDRREGGGLMETRTKQQRQDRASEDGFSLAAPSGLDAHGWGMIDVVYCGDRVFGEGCTLSNEASVAKYAQAFIEAWKRRAERDGQPLTQQAADDLVAGLKVGLANLHKDLVASPAASGADVLTPGQHTTDRGSVLEIGSDVFADAVLSRIPPGTLYLRGGLPGTMEGEAGKMGFRQSTHDGLRMLVDANVKLRKWVPRPTGGGRFENVLKFSPCSKDHAGLLLERAATDPRVPEIVAVTTYPVFGPGFVIAEPGFHNGIYYDRPATLADVIPVRDRATIRTTLEDLTIDFPFAEPASRENFVGMLLTPILTPAIQGNRPFFLVKASLERTGKTKLVETVFGGTITGSKCSAMQMPADEAEMEKRITSILLRGEPLLHLDNIRESIDSPSLASLLTAERWKGRLLGSSSGIELPNNMVIAGTANNPKATGEITKRIIPITLQPANDCPELRTDFRHPDLWAYVQQKRPLVLGCLLGMVLNWLEAGRPKGKIPMGGFEDWAAVVGGIMELHGYANWLGNVEDWREGANEEKGDLRALVTEWHDRHADQPVSVADVSLIVQAHELFAEELRGMDGRAFQIGLGRVLKRCERIPVNGLMIRRVGTQRPATYKLAPATRASS
jgi:hypothetical protein